MVKPNNRLFQKASMGPRQKCLGNILTWCWSHSANMRFNGAETKMSRKFYNRPHQRPNQIVLQWGRDKNVSEIHTDQQKHPEQQQASMGPRQKCLGNDWLLNDE